MAKKLTTPPRSLAELTADPDNPRVISDAALAGLGVSTQEFGDLSGIVWNRRTTQLVCGHQRVKALGAAGADAWVLVDDDHGYIVHPKTGERFPIRVVDWDLTKQRIANLVANSPSVAGEFTEAALAQVRALEDDALFESLRLDNLQKTLITQFHGSGDGAEDGGGDDSAKLSDSFALIIECDDESQQTNLLERFMAEGLRCRAIL